MSDSEWPEWLSPKSNAIHFALENEIKRALDHCHLSSDAAGMPWTTEGWISCSASNISSLLKRWYGFAPDIGRVEPIPLPRQEVDQEAMMDWLHDEAVTLLSKLGVSESDAEKVLASPAVAEALQGDDLVDLIVAILQDETPIDPEGITIVR